MYKWQLSGEWFSADIRNVWKLWRTGPSLISLAVQSRQQGGGITWLCAASAQELTQPQGTSNVSCLWYLGSWFGSAINGWERVESLPRQLSAMDNVFWELKRKPRMLQKRTPFDFSGLWLGAGCFLDALYSQAPFQETANALMGSGKEELELK